MNECGTWTALSCLCSWTLWSAALLALFRIVRAAIGKNVTVHYNESFPLYQWLPRECPSLFSSGYHPTPWLPLGPGHLQTVLANVFDSHPEPAVPYYREVLQTPDGGKLALDWCLAGVSNVRDVSRQIRQRPNHSICLILHGLTGGSRARYVRSIVDKMVRNSFDCVVLNARGCGQSEVVTPRLFCAAETADVRFVAAHLRARRPTAPMTAVGISLGANILVKWLGEEGDRAPVCAAASLANPFDMVESSRALCRWDCWLYRTQLGASLRKLFYRHRSLFANHEQVDIDAVVRTTAVRDFDEQLTRRVFGYHTVDDYYRDASSAKYVPFVRVPLLCLQADDDPISVMDAIPFDEASLNPYVVLAVTNGGGHVGWLEGWRMRSWVKSPVQQFFASCIAHLPESRLQGGHGVSKEALEHSLVDGTACRSFVPPEVPRTSTPGVRLSSTGALVPDAETARGARPRPLAERYRGSLELVHRSEPSGQRSEGESEELSHESLTQILADETAASRRGVSGEAPHATVASVAAEGPEEGAGDLPAEDSVALSEALRDLQGVILQSRARMEQLERTIVSEQ